MKVAVLSFGAMPEGSQTEPCGSSAGFRINRFFFPETDDEVLSTDALFRLWGELHASTMHVRAVDAEGRTREHVNLPSDPGRFLKLIEPYREQDRQRAFEVGLLKSVAADAAGTSGREDLCRSAGKQARQGESDFDSLRAATHGVLDAQTLGVVR